MAYEQLSLANTGLKSARLGIGTAYGLKAKDLVWAVENGINYIFWGSFKRGTVPKAIQMLGPSKRDKVILVAPCYSHKILSQPSVIKLSLQRALQRAKTDFVDIYQLGYISSKPSDKIIEALQEIKDQGLAKHIAISTHNRKLAEQLIQDSPFEIFMIRYNAANRGAENEIFPFVDPKRHVIVSFTATKRGKLLKKPYSWPEGKYRPAAVDCYRFVLSRPEVNVCLTGAKNRKELEENLKALELGPMSEQELAKIKEFGDIVYGIKS